MSEVIDWRGLADRLGTITWNAHGRSEVGGTDIACNALVEIVGDAALRDAVDFYASGQPGNEMARSVLMLLKPPAAMERCREIFREPADEQEAMDAINLLKMVADRRVLEWVPELMESNNEGVRLWTLGILDQLLIMQDAITPEEAAPFFRLALSDVSENVRAHTAHILDEFAQEDCIIAVRALLQ